MLAKLGARLTYANVAATLALLLAVGALGGPALADPVMNGTASAAQSVKRALKLARSADKRSKRALKEAKKSGPKGAQGAQGPQGAPGNDLQFTGAARVFHSVAQAVPNNSTTVLSFDSEAFDTGGFHSTTTNNDRLVAPRRGFYQVSANVSWEIAAGDREIRILKGGSSNVTVADAETPANSGQFTRQNLSGLTLMEAGDFVIVAANQLSGGSLNIQGAAGDNAPVLAMHWVGPG